MSNPEIESVKLWIASEIIAIEFDNIPTIILKAASKKLMAIKTYPDCIIVLLRDFSIVLF